MIALAWKFRLSVSGRIAIWENSPWGYHEASIGMTKKRSPEILEVNSQQVQQMLDRAARKLSAEDAELMRRIVESYDYISDLVEDKNTTIARLRKLFFGSKTEKSDQVLSESDDDSSDPADGDDSESNHGSSEPGQTPSSESESEKEPVPGHGRYGADDYSGGQQVEVKHSKLQAGDDCPSCGQGILYEKKPSVLVRFVGQAPLSAKVYRMQRLRCHTCGEVFTAEVPQEAGQTKYDHSVASMIGLLKYGSGFPFNRLQRLQRNCEIPLAASTQWEIVSSATELFRPAYRELIRQAADGDVVYNDDTTVKILELMGERFRQITSRRR